MTELMPEMSEKHDVILTKIVAAKKDLGHIVVKDSKNPYHKSSYASLEAHLAACENVMNNHDLLIMQNTNGSFEKPLLITSIFHPESDQWVKSYLPLPNPKGDCQGIGASLTYMRRYALNSMLGLTAADDDGESACERPKADPKPTFITAKQVIQLVDLKNKLTEEYKVKMDKWMLDTLGVNEFTKLLPKDFDTIVGKLNATIDYLGVK